jgi:hypothetical protein
MRISVVGRSTSRQLGLAERRARAHGRAISARGLLVLGFAVLALLWLVSVGILIHDAVSWWAEFAVRSTHTTGDGVPFGW